MEGHPKIAGKCEFESHGRVKRIFLTGALVHSLMVGVAFAVLAGAKET